MKRVLLIILIASLLAPSAFADTPPAATPPSQSVGTSHDLYERHEAQEERAEAIKHLEEGDEAPKLDIGEMSLVTFVCYIGAAVLTKKLPRLASDAVRVSACAGVGAAEGFAVLHGEKKRIAREALLDSPPVSNIESKLELTIAPASAPAVASGAVAK